MPLYSPEINKNSTRDSVIHLRISEWVFPKCQLMSKLNINFYISLVFLKLVYALIYFIF